MIHPDLFYRLWVQQENARIRDLEFRRARKEASEARREAPRRVPRQERTRARRPGFIEVAIRLMQVGVSWISLW
jgi:hypothetical protein